MTAKHSDLAQKVASEKARYENLERLKVRYGDEVHLLTDKLDRGEYRRL